MVNNNKNVQSLYLSSPNNNNNNNHSKVKDKIKEIENKINSNTSQTLDLVLRSSDHQNDKIVKKINSINSTTTKNNLNFTTPHPIVKEKSIKDLINSFENLCNSSADNSSIITNNISSSNTISVINNINSSNINNSNNNKNKNVKIVPTTTTITIENNKNNNLQTQQTQPKQQENIEMIPSTTPPPTPQQNTLNKTMIIEPIKLTKQIDRILSFSTIQHSQSSPSIPSPRFLPSQTNTLKNKPPKHPNNKKQTINNNDDEDNNLVIPKLQKSTSAISSLLNNSNNNNQISSSYPTFKNISNNYEYESLYNNLLSSSSIGCSSGINSSNCSSSLYYSNNNIKSNLNIPYTTLETYLTSYFDLHFNYFINQQTQQNEINNQTITTTTTTTTSNTLTPRSASTSTIVTPITKIEIYTKSVQELTNRLLEIYFNFQKRNNIEINNINGNGKEITKEFNEVLMNVSMYIQNYIPCNSSILNNGEMITCENLKLNHEFHFAKRNKTVEKSGIFGCCFKKQYQVPYTVSWSGEFQSLITFTDLSSFLNNQLDINNTSTSTNSTTPIPLSNLTNTNIINSNKVCFGCCLSVPSIECYPCNHVICKLCKIENNGNCIICLKDSNSLTKYFGDVSFPIISPDEIKSSMGIRILSLDGIDSNNSNNNSFGYGGNTNVTSNSFIKNGISQCLILEEIEKQLYGTSVTELFDFIIGNNSGGIISLGLSTGKSPSQIIDLFDKILKKVFKFSSIKNIFNLNLFNNNAHNNNSNNNNGTNGNNDKNIKKYKIDKLVKCLTNELQISNCKIEKSHLQNKTKFSVVSCLESSGSSTSNGNKQKQLPVVGVNGVNKSIKLVPCIFPFYSRIPIVDGIKEIKVSSISDAAAATSSISSLFQPYKIGNDKFRDNSNGNTLSIALNEVKTLWTHNNIDICTSISLSSNTIKQTTIPPTIDEKKLYKLETTSNSKQLNNSTLLSSSLDSISSVDEQYKKTIKNVDLKQTFTIVNSMCSRLLSSLFYLDELEFINENNHSYCNNQIKGIIKCKLKKIPSQIVNQLNIKSFVVEQGEIELIEVNMHPFSIPFKCTTINNEIDIKCNLLCLNGNINNTSISGCPFSLNNQFYFKN